jgi:hypothetical protein
LNIAARLLAIMRMISATATGCMAGMLHHRHRNMHGIAALAPNGEPEKKFITVSQN